MAKEEEVCALSCLRCSSRCSALTWCLCVADVQHRLDHKKPETGPNLTFRGGYSTNDIKDVAGEDMDISNAVIEHGAGLKGWNAKPLFVNLDDENGRLQQQAANNLAPAMPIAMSPITVAVNCVFSEKEQACIGAEIVGASTEQSVKLWYG